MNSMLRLFGRHCHTEWTGARVPDRQHVALTVQRVAADDAAREYMAARACTLSAPLALQACQDLNLPCADIR